MARGEGGARRAYQVLDGISLSAAARPFFTVATAMDPYSLTGLTGKAGVDKGKMLERVYRYPEDLESAFQMYYASGEKVLSALPLVGEEIRGIVLSGMGGSAIGGLFLKDLLFGEEAPPVIVERGLQLPGFVTRKKYLYVSVSYSGNTEETLRCLREAIERGIKPVCISSNGYLQRIAEKKGLPCFKLPRGLPPRLSFPYMAVALLSILDFLGVGSYKEEIPGAIDFIRRIRDDYFSRLSKGKDAVELSSSGVSGEGLGEHISEFAYGKTPVIYSYAPYVSPGYRAKTQFNENAKVHAFYGELPEVNHNEIMGWSCEATARFKPVVLRGSLEAQAMKHRIDFLLDNLWRGLGVEPLVVTVKSDSLLAELLTLYFAVDAISVVAALKRGVDPTPVDTISRLKEYLAEHISPEEYLGGLL